MSLRPRFAYPLPPRHLSVMNPEFESVEVSHRSDGLIVPTPMQTLEMKKMQDKKTHSEKNQKNTLR